MARVHKRFIRKFTESEDAGKASSVVRYFVELGELTGISDIS